MFKTVKVIVTAERNWGDVNLLSLVGLWLMLRKMCCYYKHSEDMIRIVDVGFFLTQLVTVALLVWHFSYMRHVCFLVSLFYGKCYVTMFIREYVAFSYRYWGKFLPKMRRNCLESCFFIENVGFCFSFPSFVESIFFWAFLSATFYIFFWVVNDLTDFVGFAIYFFFIVMKRHNRFFLNWWLLFYPSGT